MKKHIKLGTRASLLAVTQSTWVKDQIENQYPGTTVELVRITTKGDKILDVPLAKVGGKGLFVKELEDALLEGKVDLAVHSMKDVPSELPEGLQVAIVPVRENPYDAFISIKYTGLDDMPSGSKIGTSSLRRKAQLGALRPDLTILDLRGNLDTRLRKLEEGQYDAIILAAAGLNRLGMADRITSLFNGTQMLPAVGQGSLGIELRESDTELIQGLGFLHHTDTAVTVAAERAFLLTLEGGCQVPIGAFATTNGAEITLTGLIASEDGSEILKQEMTGPADNPARLGVALAEKLLQAGGRKILDVVYGNQSTEK